MGRVLLAVIAGYLLMAALSAAAQLAIGSVAGTQDTAVMAPAYLAAAVLCRGTFALLGGWLGSVIARQRTAALGLGLLVLILGLSGTLVFGAQPLWFGISEPVIAAAAAFVGGMIRAERPQPVPWDRRSGIVRGPVSEAVNRQAG